MTEILSLQFWNNSVYDWLIALAIIIGILILLKIFKIVVFQRLKNWAKLTTTTWDEFFLRVIERSVLPLLYVSTLYFVIQTLTFSPRAISVMHVAYMIAVTFFAIRIIIAAFQKFVYSYIQRDDDSDMKEKQAGGLIAIVNIIIWILGIVFLVDNMGYDVTTIIAGLGVGGIAIALAAQTILGDLFSYFVIFFDRPFQIGDTVAVGTDTGVIEYIGIKTTRIRTLSGEQLICSNTDLTNSRMRNFKRMERRRIVFTIGVTYQTTAGQLAAIPEMVKEIIVAQPNVTFDRGHFSAFGDFSLKFEFVYYVENPEYAVYMSCQQSIYLAMFSAFEKEGIQFAYPTQTVLFDESKSEADDIIRSSKI